MTKQTRPKYTQEFVYHTVYVNKHWPPVRKASERIQYELEVLYKFTELDWLKADFILPEIKRVYLLLLPDVIEDLDTAVAGARRIDISGLLNDSMLDDICTGITRKHEKDQREKEKAAKAECRAAQVASELGITNAASRSSSGERRSRKRSD